MAWSTPQVPVPGTAITSAWAAQTVVDNLNWLRAMTGQASPPGSGYVAESSSVGMTAWVQMVRRNGDQMANDLMVTRSLLGHAEQGYLFLGIRRRISSASTARNTSSRRRGSASTTTSRSPAELRRRPGTSSWGVAGPGHFFGWDGTNHVINGSAVWFDGNAHESGDDADDRRRERDDGQARRRGRHDAEARQPLLLRPRRSRRTSRSSRVASSRSGRRRPRRAR